MAYHCDRFKLWRAKFLPPFCIFFLLRWAWERQPECWKHLFLSSPCWFATLRATRHPARDTAAWNASSFFAAAGSQPCSAGGGKLLTTFTRLYTDLDLTPHPQLAPTTTTTTTSQLSSYHASSQVLNDHCDFLFRDDVFWIHTRSSPRLLRLLKLFPIFLEKGHYALNQWGFSNGILISWNHLLTTQNHCRSNMFILKAFFPIKLSRVICIIR